ASPFREAACLLYRVRFCLSRPFCDFFEAARLAAGVLRLPSGGRKTVLYEHERKKSTLFFKFFDFFLRPPEDGPAGGLLYIIQ
ncbi:MAG TPA: hypothetical protein H9773_06505, partial [Candidatus Fournierella merdavium]|nr:hypothetical protein [Candidatus Fournierella merdavium]